MGRRPKNYVPLHTPVLIECVRCGENKAEIEFYSNKQSRIYNTKKRVPLCKDCVQALLEDYSIRYGEETAVFALCGIMDLPFLPERYKKIAETTPPFSFWNISNNSRSTNTEIYPSRTPYPARIYPDLSKQTLRNIQQTSV